jgi:hypothetical protein
MKKLFILTVVLLLAIPALAQSPETLIPRNAKVFIHPMENGFDTYLAAAFEKKKTPVLVVTDIEKADFEIKGTSSKKDAGAMKTIFGSGRPEVTASIQVINIKSSVAAYSVASHKGDAWRGYKSAAEHCAKNLKEWIEKGEKGAKKN